MSASEYDGEPVRGLPAELPGSERLLWQGTPRAWSLACGALRVPLVAGYFACIALWPAVSAWSGTHDPAAVLMAVRAPLLLGLVACLVLYGIGWAAARATVYSITTRRIVIRHGIALPMSLNLPFAQIESAALRRRRDGSGDIALRIARPQRIGYLLSWPHVRPGHYLQPQPSLRGLADAERAAQVLATALRGSAERSMPAAAPAAQPPPPLRPASTAGMAA